MNRWDKKKLQLPTLVVGETPQCAIPARGFRAEPFLDSPSQQLRDELDASLHLLDVTYPSHAHSHWDQIDPERSFTGHDADRYLTYLSSKQPFDRDPKKLGEDPPQIAEVSSNRDGIDDSRPSLIPITDMATKSDETIVRVGEFSDGDDAKRPSMPPYSAGVPDIYLKKIADMWMKDKNQAANGVKYSLDRLPDGYQLFEKPRINQQNVRADKYLWGHPSGKGFDSPATFYPHFKYLMEYESGVENTHKCTCKLCDVAYKKSVRQVKGPGSATKKNGMRSTKFLHPTYDRERPDVFETIFQKAADQRVINEDIKDNLRMDMETPGAETSDLIKTLLNQPSYVPRKGELVLFYRKELDGELKLDRYTGHFKVWNSSANEYRGFPNWEVGIVTETPMEKVVHEDLVCARDKTTPVTSYGFRVEDYPDPNHTDKGFSTQYKYLPLHHLRPLCFWGEFLTGPHRERLHPTVWHGLRIISSLSVLEKYHVDASWPRAMISCKGAWVGAELILVGDAIRLFQPKPANASSEAETAPNSVLVVQDIKLEVKRLDSKDDLDLKLSFIGCEYTIDADKAYSPVVISPEECVATLPQGMWTYNWYRSHDHSKPIGIPVERVLGRCYDAEAMMMWMDKQLRLENGWNGMNYARTYSINTDLRREEGQRWFWGEDRAEQLGLDSTSAMGVDRADERNGITFWIRLQNMIANGPRPLQTARAMEMTPRVELAEAPEEDDETDSDAESTDQAEVNRQLQGTSKKRDNDHGSVAMRNGNGNGNEASEDDVTILAERTGNKSFHGALTKRRRLNS
ncbi:MAG: hypothetical protein M1837_000705 [Sclerophora amabilis]|nr:MAG: hypothetical protein M1837_000705 [Sclerophora amabilis]